MRSTVSLRARRGRPRKFQEPSKAITLTLPHAVLAALRRVDPDPSRAVVSLAQPELKKNAKANDNTAEIARFGRSAIILVNPRRALEKHTGISLVPLPGGRALISFDQSMTVANLELALREAIEERKLGAEDARYFRHIATLLKSARLAHDVKVEQRQIIVLHTHRKRPGAGRRRT
jgi:hypothetical protein